ILGILKSGGAYLPIDTAYPAERLAFMIEDARPPIVISEERLKGHLRAYGARLLLLDQDWVTIAAASGENPVNRAGLENLAYVLYTSGSTGRPKGVALEHQSAATFVQWAQTVFSPAELAGVLFATSVCFDLSIFEIFVPLSVGGKVIVVENVL